MLARQKSKIVPIHEWPAEAQRRWFEAWRPRDILDPERPPVSWKDVTKSNVALCYGAWLGWRKSEHDKEGSPQHALFPDPKELLAYVRHMRGYLANSTVRRRIEFLSMAVSVLEPAEPRQAFKAILANLPKDSPSLRKRQRLQSARSLIELGIKLMEAAGADPSRDTSSCRQFRDGFQIALLAARPLRKKNFSSLRVGTHIRIVRGQWRITVPGHETKTGQPIDVPFPPMLVEQLTLYLREVRPRLLKSSTEALWISQYGQQQSADSISDNIERLTAKEFGQPINLHLFRDCAATSIAVEDPKNINIVASVLGHGSLAASQGHYNQARSVDASRRFLATMTSLRGRLRPKAKRKNGTLCTLVPGQSLI